MGQTFSAVVAENLTRTQIVQYAGASGDYNPLHTDEVFATQVAGYPSVFAHGMLTMGCTGRMLTDLVGDGRLLAFGGRFTVPGVAGRRPHDHRHGRGRGRRRTGTPTVDLTVSTTNQDGVEVFAGRASARIEE